MVPSDQEIRAFLLEEYKALRAEILAKIERVMRIQILGITGIPVIIGVGKGADLSFLVAVSPVFTIIFTLLVLYENAGIMRAGRYVRTRVEPELLKGSSAGWEKWLEDFSENRKAEKYFAFATYLAFSLYFLGGTYLAIDPLTEMFGRVAAAVVITTYVLCYFVAMGWVIRALPTGTGPKDISMAEDTSISGSHREVHGSGHATTVGRTR